MTKERWLEIKDLIKERFGKLEEGADSYEEQGGVEVSWLQFETPLGLIRLEYETKPVIIDKKTHGSNRMGSEAHVQYIYSPTEKNAKLYAYKYDEPSEDWQEIDLNQLALK
jgi:hypothetical protein